MSWSFLHKFRTDDLLAAKSAWLASWRTSLADYKALPELVIRRYFQDGCAGLAASLTYTTLFALVPLFTLLVSIFSLLPESEQYQQQLIEPLMSFLVPQVGEVVQEYLQAFSVKASQLTAMGLAILLATSVLMIYNIEQAFNRIWRVRRSRKSLYAFMLYWTFLSLGPILIGATLALSASLSNLAWWLDLPSVVSAWQLWLARGLEVLAFTLLYWVVPNHGVRLRYALVGALLMTALFEVAKWLFAFFIQNFPSYEFIYGAFAAIPLFLLWVYLSWQMILLSAQLVAVLDLGLVHHKSSPPIPLALQPVMALLVLWQHFNQQQGVSEYSLRHYCGYPKLEEWNQVMSWLRKHWMVQDAAGQWRLAANPHQISASHWLQTLPWRLPLAEEWPASMQGLTDLRLQVQEIEQAQKQLWRGSLAELLQSQQSLLAKDSLVGNR